MVRNDRLDVQTEVCLVFGLSVPDRFSLCLQNCLSVCVFFRSSDSTGLSSDLICKELLPSQCLFCCLHSSQIGSFSSVSPQLQKRKCSSGKCFPSFHLSIHPSILNFSFIVLVFGSRIPESGRFQNQLGRARTRTRPLSGGVDFVEYFGL